MPVLGVYEDILDHAVRIMLIHIVHESGPARDSRVRKPFLVPGYPHYGDLLHITAVRQQVGAQIAALVHRHAEICKIVVIFKLGINVHVRYPPGVKFLHELQGLHAEHGGDDDAGRILVQGHAACTLERLHVILVILHCDNRDTVGGSQFHSPLYSLVGQFPEVPRCKLRNDADYLVYFL